MPVTGHHSSSFENLPDAMMFRINRLCNEFEIRWRQGEPFTIEDMLNGVENSMRMPLLKELLPIEIDWRRRTGRQVTLDEYTQRFPEISADCLQEFVHNANDTADSGVPILSEFPDVLGDYSIVRRIGEGGMGTVYEARHERMGRTVAIKVLRQDLAGHPQTTERFAREIRAAASLAHRNIVTAYDSREEHGVAFLVSEFVEGMTLSHLVQQRGPLPAAEAIDYIRQAAEGLQYAHAQGIIHRDIKPQNLMIQRTDAGDTQRTALASDTVNSDRADSSVLKILDFGLARLRNTEAGELTNSNMLIGTLAYMAPEQALRPKEADLRADIYSLGCTFYFLLTGRVVYPGDSAIGTALAHVKDPVPTLSTLRPQYRPVIDPILSRMLAKDPAERFQSMGDVIVALNGIVIPRESAGRSNRRPIQVIGGILIAVVLGAVAVRDFLPDAQPDTRPDQGPGRLPPPVAVATETPAADRWALSFNKTSSYLELDSPAVGVEPVTMEAIVTVAEPKSSVVCVWHNDYWHFGIGMSIEGQWTIGYCRSEGDAQNPTHVSNYAYSDQPAMIGQRVHLRGVFDGTHGRLYVDGRQLPLTVEAGHAPVNLNRVIIGNNPPAHLMPDRDYPERNFKGLIHAIRISRGIRNRDDFNPPVAFTASPGDDSILTLDLEEGTGSLTHDVLQRSTAKIFGGMGAALTNRGRAMSTAV